MPLLERAFWAAATWLIRCVAVVAIVGGAVAMMTLLWREWRYAMVRREMRREDDLDHTPASDRLSAARARLDAAARTDTVASPLRDVSRDVVGVGGRRSIH